MMDDQKKRDLLRSWKEIAAYLDIDVRTCRRWEKDHGLPIHRINRDVKSSIFAYKKELDEWLELKANYKTKAKGRKLLRFSRRMRFILLISVSVTIVLLTIFWSSLSGRSKPVDFTIKNSYLIVLDKKGKELWRWDSEDDNLEVESLYRRSFQHRRPSPERAILPLLIIKDINHDRKEEVLFAVEDQGMIGQFKLVCLNHKGSEIWHFWPGRQLRFGAKTYSKDCMINGFDIFDFNHDGKLEVIAIAGHLYDWPTQLIALDCEGKVMGEYWNGGRFSDFIFSDLDKDGALELIIGGVNNEYKKACLAVFDPNFIKGASPQSNDYKCEELEPGSEKYYILLPRTDVDAQESVLEAVGMINLTGNGNISVLTLVSRIYYEFNSQLECQSVLLSTQFKQKRNKAILEGRIKNISDEEYVDALKNGILYSDGKNWRLRPIGISH
jgi:hypothetical protein